jgi:rubredoxin
MYLKSWEPVVESSVGHPYGSISLVIRALLECPVCKERSEVSSQAYVFPGIGGSEKAGVTQFDEVAAQWRCKKCGVVSALPDADCQKLREEIAKKITTAWLKRQDRRLNPSFTSHKKAA